MKTKVIISVIALLLCIAVTAGLRIVNERADIDYDEIKVVVVSSETKKEKVLGRWQTIYEVIVRYEGKKYRLKNTHDTYSYSTGREVTAFLAGGELYANVDGVRTSTPLGKAYFVFLFASFGMVIVTLSVAGKAWQRAQNI